MTDAEILAQLPGLAFAFGMVLARVVPAMMLLPGVGEVTAPRMMRAAIALAVSVLLLPVVVRVMPPEPPSVAGVVALLGAEIVTGLWLGWLARLLMLALSMAGGFAGFMVGLSNVLQPDPALGAEEAILGRALSVLAPVLVLSTGLYALPLRALAGSYDLIAPGTMLPTGDTAQSVARAVEQSFAFALRLAGPFVLAGLLWQVAIGLIGRLVPHLQVNALAVPAQIMLGVALFGLLASPLAGAWLGMLRDGFSALPGAG